MTLLYADPFVPGPKRLSRMSSWIGILLTALFAFSATLCYRAERSHMLATYEDTHRRWWQDWGPENYSSFKVWQARRNSWVYASRAAVVAGAALLAAAACIGFAWVRARRWSRWLLAAIALHALVVLYFVARWGPDFRAPFGRVGWLGGGLAMADEAMHWGF